MRFRGEFWQPSQRVMREIYSATLPSYKGGCFRLHWNYKEKMTVVDCSHFVVGVCRRFFLCFSVSYFLLLQELHYFNIKSIFWETGSIGVEGICLIPPDRPSIRARVVL